MMDDTAVSRSNMNGSKRLEEKVGSNNEDPLERDGFASFALF